MFYSGNDNYMQDLYFGNQMYGANTYNPNGMNNMTNPMYMNNGMCPNQFQNQIPNQPVSINNMYPSLYRILMPVISRVVSNSNYQFFNEDVLNNMVDTVYNITDGQINYENDNDNEQVTTQERNSNTQTNTASVSQTNQNTTTTNTSTRMNTNTQTTRNANSTNSSNDSLLRDIIKILIIRELISRRQFQNPTMQNNMNMYNMNNMNSFCNL